MADLKDNPSKKMQKANASSFLSGIAVALLVINGISNSHLVLGIVELVLSGLLMYPYVTRIWHTTLKSMVAAAKEAFKSSTYFPKDDEKE